MEETFLPPGCAPRHSINEFVFLVIKNGDVVAVCDSKEIALEIIKDCCDYIQYNEFKNMCDSWVKQNRECTMFTLYTKHKGCFSRYEQIAAVFEVHTQEKNVLM